MEKITFDNLSPTQVLILNEVDNKKVVGASVGVGKTISALYVAERHHHKSVLVIVPKMLRDLKTWETDHSKTNIDIELLVLSKEDFKKQSPELKRFDLVVLDEAGEWLLSGMRPELKFKYSKTKNPKIDTSAIFASVMNYINRVEPSEIIMLDATVAAGKPLSLFAARTILGLSGNTQAEIIDAHQAFVFKFYHEIPMGYSSRWKEKTVPSRYSSTNELESSQAELKRLWQEIAVFVDDNRKIKPIETDIPVIIDPQHKKELKQIEKDFAGGAVHSRIFAYESGHFKDMAFDDINHIMFPEERHIVTAKELAIVEFVSFLPKQVIIFSTFTAQQNHLKKLLSQDGIVSEIINGTTSTEERAILVGEFRKGNLQVLIIQSSICAGYNMPECDTIIRASSPIKAAHLTQQYGRIDRAPNYKQNYIYNFYHVGGKDEDALIRTRNGEDLSASLFTEDLDI